MLKDIDGELKQIRASGIGDLLKIVMQQFHIHCAIFREVYEKFGKIPETNVLLDHGYDLRSPSIISTVFTGMVIEAFYFDYYQDKNSKNKAEIWSKKSPINQFTSLIERYLKIPNYESLDLYQKLKDLSKVRIHWTHNKSTSMGNYPKNLNHNSADGNIQLLIDLFDIFATNDKSYVTSKVLLNILSDLQMNVKG